MAKQADRMGRADAGDPSHRKDVTIGGSGAAGLTLADVAAVARAGARVRLAPEAADRVATARAFIERIGAEGRTVYGVTTGFGHLSSVKISGDKLADLQRNLIRSHASGVGEPFVPETVRAVTLLLANSLARGHSGVRVVVIELLLGMLNAGVTPVVPKRGSVGASGDLAPLAHLALTLMGEGEALYEGERMPGGEALRRAGLEPVTLGAKEGLALINGTHVMEACGALAVADAERLVRAAEVAVAMSIEALMGSYVPLDARIHALRPQPGQQQTAARLRALLAGSEINPSHADCGRVQDPYTLRCAPQVLGAAREQCMQHRRQRGTGAVVQRCAMAGIGPEGIGATRKQVQREGRRVRRVHQLRQRSRVKAGAAAACAGIQQLAQCIQ